MRPLRPSKIALVLLAAASLAACRYRGALDDTSYVPAERAKLGASIAFVDDGAFDKAQLVGNDPAYLFTLRIGPAMRQAFLKELEATFASVTSVSQPGAQDASDFYAFPDVAWIPVRPDGAGYAYRLGVRLVVMTRQGRAVLADYREVTSVAFRPPAEAKAAAIATGITLYALAPITEPMKTDSFGKEVEKAATAGIADVMHRLGNEMASDQRLELAAAMGPVQDAVTQSAPSPYDKFMNAVVVIKTGDGTGSGFFVSKDGMIVTCRHVVGDAKTVEVKDRSGHTFDGEVLDSSKERDLALVKVTGADFTALPLAAATPNVGREVIAIGTPQGLSWSVSKGIVSALRSLRSAKVVQTDASFSPGSSGGPLIDPATGRAVGIASLTMGGGNGGANINIAIAAEEVQKAFGPKLSGL
jgi:S1-C subfamily serine protease